MATKDSILYFQNQGSAHVAWENLTDGDVGQPFKYCNLADKTIQSIGQSDGIITIQGSNDITVETDPDGAEWVTLTDSNGQPAVFSSSGMILLAPAPAWIRPSCSGGLTSATISMLSNGS